MFYFLVFVIKAGEGLEFPNCQRRGGDAGVSLVFHAKWNSSNRKDDKDPPQYAV